MRLKTGIGWLLLGIAAGALLIAGLALLSPWSQGLRLPGGGALRWELDLARDKLDREFTWTATLSRPPAAGERFRLVLTGDTRLIEMEGDRDGLGLWQKTGPTSRDPLASCRWPQPVTTGDRIEVTKEAAALVVGVKHVRALGVPLAIEGWRRARWEHLQPAAAPPTRWAEFSYQKLGTVYFADDFMHDEGALGEWQVVTGSWTVHALDNPIRSANAFSFFGKGEGAVVLTGYWFWRNYTVACAVHPLDTPAFGILLLHSDAANGYRLDWCREAGRQLGKLRLIKVLGGEELVLGEEMLSFAAAQWYQLEVSQIEGSFRVHVDGVPVLDAGDPQPFVSGRAGLWVGGGEGVVFDDVQVRPTDRVRYHFPFSVARWPAHLTVGTGLGEGMKPDGLDLGSVGGALAVGSLVLENVALHLDVAGLKQRTGPLELRARERLAGHVALRLSGTPDQALAELSVVEAERSRVVAVQDLPGLPESGTLGLHAEGPCLWATLDHRVLCLATDAAAVGRGICRVTGNPGAGVRLVGIQVEPQQPLPRIENWVETFTHEESMSTWSGPEAEWALAASPLGLSPWHRSDFWQDLAVELDLQAFTWRGPSATCGLVLAGGDPGAKTELVRAGLFLDGQAPELRLYHDAAAPPLAKPVPTTGYASVAIEKRGGRLLVRAGNELLWDLSLPAFLAGLVRVGRFGGEQDRGEAWARAVRIGADGVRTYSFKESPVDWLPAAGTWVVTNRWQCDPRWSFYSGSQRHGVACNWHKGVHGDRVTIEFFAGPKMDQERGERYEYVADINAVLGADGRDIATGYSFLFGGRGDTGSYILRGSRELAKNPAVVLPRSSSIHRRWFHLKMRKDSGHLALWVDGELVAAADDPDPLPGRHLGLWTWDNGVMIAHVRVSTDGAMVPESTVQSQPPVPRTPYDEK